MQESSRERMIDVGEKTETLREAEAEAVLTGQPAVLRALWEGRLPKGDAQPAAEIAGILAAKRTPELLPMCHPIRLDAVQVHLRFEGERIVIRAIARTHDRTGVEMEVLTAVTVAALTLYDWAKSQDPAMEFSVRLVRKSGGKSGVWERSAERPRASEGVLSGIRAGVLTVSDRASRGMYADESGAFIQQWLRERGADVADYVLVPDEPEQVMAAISRMADELQVDLVLTTGGTGFSPRDRTPEATRAALDRETPGITEWLRLQTGLRKPYAFLSRATAGIRGRTLVINLPGSVKAVREHLEVLPELLPHAIEMARGGDHGGAQSG